MDTSNVAIAQIELVNRVEVDAREAVLVAELFDQEVVCQPPAENVPCALDVLGLDRLTV